MGKQGRDRSSDLAARRASKPRPTHGPAAGNRRLTPEQAIERFDKGTRVPMAGVLSPPTGDPTKAMEEARTMAGAAGEIRLAYLLWWYRSHPSEAPVPLAWSPAVTSRAQKYLRRVAADVEKLAVALPGLDTKEGMAAMLIGAFVHQVRADRVRPKRKIRVSPAEDGWPRIASDLRVTAFMLRRAAAMFPPRTGRRENRALNDFVCDLRERVLFPGGDDKPTSLGPRRIALLCIGADVDPDKRDDPRRYDLDAMTERVAQIRRRHAPLYLKLTKAVLEHVGVRA